MDVFEGRIRRPATCERMQMKIEAKALMFALSATGLLLSTPAFARGQSVRDDCINVQTSPMTLEGQVVNGEEVLSLTNNCGVAVSGQMAWPVGAMGFSLGAGEKRPHFQVVDSGTPLKYYVCAQPDMPAAPGPNGRSIFYVNYNTPKKVVSCLRQ